jgi:hypothetical protein
MAPLNNLVPLSLPRKSAASGGLSLGAVSEGPTNEAHDEDDNDDDDNEFIELERGGPRGRSMSIERKCELRSERDLMAFSALAKMALQRLDHAEEIRKQNESIVAGEIFSALDETGDGEVEFWELQHFLRHECQVFVTEAELSVLHSFDLTRLRGKAFVTLVKDAYTGEVAEQFDVVASINADIEAQIDTSFTPRALAKFLAVPSHHKVHAFGPEPARALFSKRRSIDSPQQRKKNSGTHLRWQSGLYTPTHSKDMRMFICLTPLSNVSCVCCVCSSCVPKKVRSLLHKAVQTRRARRDREDAAANAGRGSRGAQRLRLRRSESGCSSVAGGDVSGGGSRGRGRPAELARNGSGKAASAGGEAEPTTPRLDAGSAARKPSFGRSGSRGANSGSRGASSGSRAGLGRVGASMAKGAASFFGLPREESILAQIDRTAKHEEELELPTLSRSEVHVFFAQVKRTPQTEFYA